MKRKFGYFEWVFDLLYLVAALTMGVVLLVTPGSPVRALAGVMALVLAGGDAFHLLPRMAAIYTGNQARFLKALGTGKQITSITMTVFYVLLWHVGLGALGVKASSAVVYILAALRILLCLLPQNCWREENPPVRWGVYRNIPFVLLGLVVGAFFGLYGLHWVWVAIALSFLCYLPVVLWVDKKPKLGMLMLPKTCAYIWLLILCFWL